MSNNTNTSLRAKCTFEEAYRALFDIALYAYYNFNEECRTKYMNIFLLSLEGNGKTYFMNKYAKEKGLKCETVIAKSISFSDLNGLEIPEGNSKSGKHLTFLPPQWLVNVKEVAEREKREGKPIFLFLDEFTAVDLDTKKVFLSIILDRKLRNFTLPDNVIIIAAGNFDDRDIDAPTYNRFIVASLDRTQLEQLPVCMSTESEIKEIIALRAYYAFGKGDKIELMNHEFYGLTVPDSEIDHMLSVIEEVLCKALVVRNTTYSPQDLNLDDKTGGAKNLSMSLRMAGFVTDFLIAAKATNNWKPIILRIAADNLGCFDKDGKPLYSYLTQIKTELVVSGDFKITYDDYVKKYEYLGKKQFLFQNLNKIPEDEINLMNKEFNYLLSTYESGLTEKPKDLYKTYKVTLGCFTVPYTDKLTDSEDDKKLFMEKVICVDKFNDNLVKELLLTLDKVRKIEGIN